MKPFKSKKAMWSAIAVIAVIGGFFVAALLLPSAGKPMGSDSLDVQVPGMRNVPEQGARPGLELETREE